MEKENQPTPYQQSLLGFKKNKSWANFLFKILSLTGIYLLAFGFFCEANGTLPGYLTGWLLFVSIGYVIVNWLCNIVFLLLQPLVFLVKAGLQATNEIREKEDNSEYKDKVPDLDIDIAVESSKISHGLRNFVVDIVKGSNLFTVQKLSVKTVLDIIGDWTLFVLMVTTNHPVLAFFHSTAILLQYWLLARIKKKFKELVLLLPDPLEETQETDYDDLMDKLCNPEASDETGPKEN